jgi:hypothetical protein
MLGVKILETMLGKSPEFDLCENYFRSVKAAERIFLKPASHLTNVGRFIRLFVRGIYL